jgi:hypothetical protein
MREENRIVHGLWIGDRLSLLEQLTITLFQNHGHEFHLWSYKPLENSPTGTVWRNAAEVLPESSLFKFDGIPLAGLPDGGKGSLSHWSDQFQCKMLHEHGGIYSQMDIAVFAPLDFESPYMFAPHTDRSIAPVVMKTPKGSDFAKTCYETLSSEINADTIHSKHWDCSMQKIMDVARKFDLNQSQYLLSKEEYWDLGTRKTGPFYNAEPPGKSVRVIHWSNATNREYKNRPIRGSFYARLLEKSGLLAASDPALQSPTFEIRLRHAMLRLKKVLVSI